MKHHSNDQKTCNLRGPMVSQFGSFFVHRVFLVACSATLLPQRTPNLMVACGMVARGLNLASLVFGIWSKQSLAEHQRVYGHATTIEATKAEIIAAVNKFDKREAEIAVGQFSRPIEQCRHFKGGRCEYKLSLVNHIQFVCNRKTHRHHHLTHIAVTLGRINFPQQGAHTPFCRTHARKYNEVAITCALVLSFANFFFRAPLMFHLCSAQVKFIEMLIN